MFNKGKYAWYTAVAMVTAAFVAGVVVYTLSEKRDVRRLSESADEGYETAFDLRFPTMRINTKQKLKYGPTLPF